MGGFAVSSAGRLLLAGDFERRKARALLAALLCAGEPVHREQLLEWFWPALSPRRGLACLFTTLYVLRRTLEPAPRSGSVSSHVLCDGESYRLHLGERGSWDGAEIPGVASTTFTAAIMLGAVSGARPHVHRPGHDHP